MMIVRIAWRNLWRNKTRTGIILSAIAFSYGLMLFIFGIADDSYREMESGILEAVGGHVLIHGDGYWDFPTGGQVVADVEERRAELKATAGVDAVAQRIIAYGLVGTARSSEGAQILGINPDDEGPFFDLEEKLVEGDYFGGERDNPIVLGVDDADSLGVGIGDRVVVTGTDLDGEMTRGIFFVDGLLEGAAGQAAEGRAYVEFDELQQILGYQDSATQLGVRLIDGDERHHFASQWRTDFEGADLEVLTWDEAVPEFVGLIEMDEAFTYFYVLIIMLIVVLGITNTFLMAVMERVREIGLLSALGLTPQRIGALIMVETVLLTLISMIIGFGLGLAGHFYMVNVGIDIAAVAGVEMEVAGLQLGDMIIHSYLDPVRWIVGTVVIFAFICASSLYPAWKATRLAPAEAMRFYE